MGRQMKTLGAFARAARPGRPLNFGQKVQVFGAFHARIQKLQKLVKITQKMAYNALYNPSFSKMFPSPKGGRPFRNPHLRPARLWRVLKTKLALFPQKYVASPIRATSSQQT